MNFRFKHKSFYLTVLSILAIITSVFMLFGGIAPKQSKMQGAINAIVTDELMDSSDATNFTLKSEFSVVDTNEPMSVSNPYVIASVDDLCSLAYWVNSTFEDVGDIAKQEQFTRASYILTKHLNLSEFNWVPIGTYENNFLGNFDGNGHTIYGLTIINQDDDIFGAYGLFGYVSYKNETPNEYAPVIQKLGLKDIIIKTQAKYVGGLVGCATGSSSKASNISSSMADSDVPTASLLIEQCYVIGYIEGATFVGGIAGSLTQGATIHNSYAAPSSQNLTIGDIVINAEQDIYLSSNSGAIGGLVGKCESVKSEEPVLVHNYSALRIGVLNETNQVSIGGLVGTVPAFTTQDTSNFSLLTSVSGLNANSFGSIISSYEKVKNNFERMNFKAAVVTGSNVWAETSKPWILSATVNNGLPALSKVPQLVRFDFDAINADDVSIMDGENLIVGIDQNDENKIAIALNTAKTSVLIEQGQSVYATRTLQKGSALEKTYTIKTTDSYGFIPYSKSYRNGVESIMANSTLDSSSWLVFTYNDAKIVVNYVLRQYNVVLGAVLHDDIQENPSQMALQINGTDTTAQVENQNSVQIVATYNDIVNMSVTPTSGTKISFSNATVGNETVYMNVQSVLDAMYNATTIAQGTVTSVPETLSASVIVDKKSYTLNLSTSGTDVEEYTVQTSPNKASGATIYANDEYVLNYAETVNFSNNYKFSHWIITTIVAGENVVVTNSTEENAVFAVGDYDDASIVSVQAVFVLKTYDVILMNNIAGEKGILTAKIGDIVQTVTSFANSQPFTIVIESNTGYDIVGVTINGNDYAFSEDAPAYDGSTPTDVYGPGSILDMFTIVGGGNSTKDCLKLNFTNLSTNISIAGMFEAENFNVDITLTNRSATTGGATFKLNNVDYTTTVQKAYKERVSLDIILEPNYVIVDVLCNGVSASVYNFEILGTTNIEVIIALKKYSVTASFVYADNSAYRVDSANITNPSEVSYGENALVEVTLPAMYEIAYWQINGQRINYQNNLYNILDVTENQNVSIFLNLKSINLNFSASGDTTYAGSYKVITSDNVYTYGSGFNRLTLKYGESVNLVVSDDYYDNGIRANRYSFAYWKINGIAVSTEKSYSLPISINMDIEAVFIPAKLTVQAYVSIMNYTTQTIVINDNAGVILGLDSSKYDYQTQLNLSNKPNTNYEFIGWYKIEGNRMILLSEECNYAFTLRENIMLYAVFGKTVNLTLVNAINSAGELQGAGAYFVGQTVEINAIANKGYRFTAWRMNRNGEQVLEKNTHYSFIIGDSDLQIVAEYEAVYSVNYTSNDSKYGQVIGSTTGKYKENIVLEAVSANNCTFIGWVIGDVVVSTSNKLNITLNSDVEVKALFKKNFDWNIIVILIGCVLFAIVIISASSAYIKMKEAEPMQVRALLNGKDDKDAIFKNHKRNTSRDTIEPVPTRKVIRENLQPIPVRKINTTPINHKGEEIKKASKAKDKKPTLKTDEE